LLLEGMISEGLLAPLDAAVIKYVSGEAGRT
jgi:hypothetical protein